MDIAELMAKIKVSLMAVFAIDGSLSLDIELLPRAARLRSRTTSNYYPSIGNHIAPHISDNIRHIANT
jgi:hypothetical protein